MRCHTFNDFIKFYTRYLNKKSFYCDLWVSETWSQFAKKVLSHISACIYEPKIFLYYYLTYILCNAEKAFTDLNKIHLRRLVTALVQRRYD